MSNIESNAAFFGMPNFGTVGELASLLAKTGNAFIQVYRDETRSQALRTPEALSDL